MDHTDSDWCHVFIELMETNPFCVTDDQLFVLFRALKSEFWKEPPPLPEIHDTYQQHLLPMWFCRGKPMMTRVVLEVLDHIKYEYTWEQFVGIMLSVLSTNESD